MPNISFSEESESSFITKESPGPSTKAGYSILVIGGSGFLGSHLVRSLSYTFPQPDIHVFDLSAPELEHHTSTYHTGSITCLSSLMNVVSTVRPRVIFHVASVGHDTTSSLSVSENAILTQSVNVDGTRNILECAQKYGVEALIYTSSASVLKAREYHGATEEAEVKTGLDRFDPYPGTKAIAERMVLEANDRRSGSLRTCSLRLAGVYGDGDKTLVLHAIRKIVEGKEKIQIGNGDVKCDFVFVENAVHAHKLAMKALLAEPSEDISKKVDGESFFITDDEPISYWEFSRRIWVLANHHVRPEEIWMVPASVVLVVATIAEWLYWVFTIGKRQPKDLRRCQIEWVCLNRTFSIAKAKERLGYNPIMNMDHGLKVAVDWGISYVGEKRLQAGKEKGAKMMDAEGPKKMR